MSKQIKYYRMDHIMYFFMSLLIRKRFIDECTVQLNKKVGHNFEKKKVQLEKPKAVMHVIERLVPISRNRIMRASPYKRL